VKLLFFEDFKFGVVKGDNVVDCSAVVGGIPHSDPQGILVGVINAWGEYRPKLEAAAAAAAGVPLSSVRIRPPVPGPSHVACMAGNYMDMGRTDPGVLDAYLKSPTAIVGSGDTMVLPDAPATIFEGEAELALVISKYASRVSAAEAPGYIFGYMNFIDGSARGLGGGLYQSKSQHSAAPVGPFLVTADEVGDAQKLQVKLWNNGVLYQDYNTSTMARNINQCVEFVTSVHPLKPGDILACGTSHGGLNPFMDGDRIEMEAERLGRLTFTVKDDLKRTWARVTREQMAAKGTPGPTPQLRGKYAKS